MSLAIIGGPKSGKTTFSEGMQNVIHTDDYMEMGWSHASESLSYKLGGSNFVMEGVATVRALRKWLARNPSGKPVDKVLFLSGSHWPLTRGQSSMAAGVATVFQEIEADLLARGVEIEKRVI